MSNGQYSGNQTQSQPYTWPSLVYLAAGCETIPAAYAVAPNHISFPSGFPCLLGLCDPLMEALKTLKVTETLLISRGITHLATPGRVGLDFYKLQCLARTL